METAETAATTAAATEAIKKTVVMQVSTARGHLVGTSGWLRDYLGKCSLQIGQTKASNLAVWLKFSDGENSHTSFVCGITTKTDYKEEKEKAGYSGEGYFDYRNFPDDSTLCIYEVFIDESDTKSKRAALFGILTPAAREIAASLINQCAEILIATFKGDTSDFTLKVVSQEQ